MYQAHASTYITKHTHTTCMRQTTEEENEEEEKPHRLLLDKHVGLRLVCSLYSLGLGSKALWDLVNQTHGRFQGCSAPLPPGLPTWQCLFGLRIVVSVIVKTSSDHIPALSFPLTHTHTQFYKTGSGLHCHSHGCLLYRSISSSRRF